jgi:hypothetical protein
VVVTGWTDPRTSWPRCRPLDVPRSHPSLLVDEELARAIRHESAAALRHWWGVSALLVWKWRKALGVDRLNCPGSQRLIRQASEQGAAQVRGKPLPPDQVEQRRRTALELGYGRRLRPGYNLGPWWSPRELALLGKLPDEEVAAKVGWAPNAVWCKRAKAVVAGAGGGDAGTGGGRVGRIHPWAARGRQCCPNAGGLATRWARTPGATCSRP